ncbi:MAG: 3-dehydroquinate synthase [Dehalococcoidia bacterium]|nr:3-dehydroquinate synthase [Dehalococcoidia bacterium]
MQPSTSTNIILIGFSGTGKSSVAPALAGALGWGYFDTDAEVSRLAAKPIEDIFRQEGEAAFRSLEQGVLRNLSAKKNTVVSTGGGVVCDPENRRLLHAAGMVVLLEAKPETILRRLHADIANGGDVRPLLAGDDPLGRISRLKAERQPHYATADWTVNTDHLSLQEVVQEVIRGWSFWRRPLRGADQAVSGATAVVTTATQSYPVWMGWDILETIGHKMVALGLSGAAHVVTDETVSHLYGERVTGFLMQAGYGTTLLALPPGETAKNLGSVSKIYDFLVANRAERTDTVVALGGGVVGDTAGFAAATYNRGIRFVQVPTTLIGIVDSSIGGKVGVDHPGGKNLIGAFYQPCMVLGDALLLTTLPRREVSAGWAEVVKHGLVADAGYFEFIENHVDEIMALEQSTVTKAISRSVEIKADVVSRDEKETVGLRTMLNYGHTIGHAIEAATGYGKYLHGEAVAVGMVGAAMLSLRMGLVGRDLVERQKKVLAELSLPVSCAGVSKPAALKAMKLDKKVARGSLRWVLLARIGEAVVRSDVPDQYVEDVLSELGLV